MQTIKKIILNVAKVGVTALILWYLYRRGMLDFTRVHNVLGNAGVVAATMLILTLTKLAGVVRWSGLLEGQDLKVHFWEVLRLTMIGVFFNTAIPGAVSGDVVKGYYVVRQQPHKKGRIKAFTTLLMDRILGLSALICVSFVAMLFNFKEMIQTPALKPLCGLITVLWLGVVVFYAFVLVESKFSHAIKGLLHKLPVGGEIFGRLFEAVKSYENGRHYIIRGMLISIGIHCSIVGAFVLLAKTLGGFVDIPVDKFFFLVPFGLLVTAIPVAPAGLGTGHAAFFGLFRLVGSSAGADLFTAFVTFQILISLIGGLFYVKYRVHLPHEKEQWV